jgi:ABC-2 type transport system ATP-binding protein
MDTENAIEVNHITKSFKVYLDKGSTLKEKVLFRNRRKYDSRQVLNGISFNIKKGEAVGLIGANGCGKSTLLKLLSQIMYPDSGSIVMQGRVSSLIELGAGFHPDMSGKQNIYTNASIFGLTRKEIDRRLEEIISFSELEAYIDNPVRTYSSGMYMRLAFSVAINVDADILLIDEILAVGDANFQAKCFNKLREIKSNGTTIVIVSHSLGQIEQICERSIWIQNGKIRASGIPYDVHPQYLEFMGNRSLPQEKKETEERAQNGDGKSKPDIATETKTLPRRWGNGKARITSIKLLTKDNIEKQIFSTGDDVYLQVDYDVIEEVKDADFGIGIFRGDGLRCYGTNTKIEQFPVFHLKQSGQMRLLLQNIPLLPGEYWLDIAIESERTIPVDYWSKAYKFQIFSIIEDVGISRINHKWMIEKQE